MRLLELNILKRILLRLNNSDGFNSKLILIIIRRNKHKQKIRIHNKLPIMNNQNQVWIKLWGIFKGTLKLKWSTFSTTLFSKKSKF